MEPWVRLWLSIKSLGEVLGEHRMWGMFEWVANTLGDECPKLDPIARQLLADSKIGPKLKEIRGELEKIFGGQ